MTLEQALIAGITVLASVVGVLFALLIKAYKHHEELQAKNVDKMAKASDEFTRALKHQTEITDKIFSYITKATKR